MTKAQEIAWLAGLLDGEGCFSIKHPAPSTTKRAPNARNRLYVQLAMCDRDLVARALKIVSGTICTSFRGRTSKHKDIHKATWTGTQAENLMQRVLPYMGEA